MKKSAQTLGEMAGEKSRMLELKALNPIFLETLNDTEFLVSKFVRIADRDKKHADSEVCKGSIGFISEQKRLRMVNIFQDSVDAFGLSFYPDCGSGFYYVDPSDREHYIALDDYFGYLKLARINELQKLAQDLGAKHFRVTYKEEKTAFSEKKTKANVKAIGMVGVEPRINELQKLAQDLGAKHFRVTYKEEKTAFSEKKTKANVKAIGMVGVEHDYNAKKYSTVEVAAEMTFPGHVPVNPMVKYLKHDPSVKTLISMRMNETAPLLHQKFMLKLSNSSGIKESEAIKIDAVLKGMKRAGNATVVSEVQNESRRYLEYEIDF